MFEAQPNRGGTDGENADHDQAINATYAALQDIWYNGEAIAAHQDSADRVEDGDAREDGSQQQGRRDNAIERPEQHKHNKCTAQRCAKAHTALEGWAERRAEQVPNASRGDNQAVEYGRKMVLLHNRQDDKDARCHHKVEIAGDQDHRAPGRGRCLPGCASRRDPSQGAPADRMDGIGDDGADAAVAGGGGECDTRPGAGRSSAGAGTGMCAAVLCEAFLHRWLGGVSQQYPARLPKDGSKRPRGVDEPACRSGRSCTLAWSSTTPSRTT
jgi:hypothetical protein